MSFEASEHTARPLSPGRDVDAEIADGEVHAYELNAGAGDLVRVTAEQKGGDVLVRLFAGRVPVTSMDSPTGSLGAEVVSAVADEATSYRVEIHLADPDAPGPYTLSAERRPAAERDRTHVAAEHDFADGEELRRHGDDEAALVRYTRAAEGFRQASAAAPEAQARYRVAWMKARLGREGWRPELEAAAERFTALGDRRMEMRALNRLGHALVGARRLNEALPYFERALPMARELDDSQALAGCLAGLSDVYGMRGEPHRVQEVLLEAISLWQRSGDTASEANSWLRLGNLYLSLNRLEEAEQALGRARQLSSGDPAAEAAAERSFGELHYRREEHAEARAALERALGFLDTPPDAPLARAHVLSDLGTVLLAAGETEAAGEHFDQALDIQREQGNPRGEAMMLHKLGRQRYALGDLEGSRRRHGEAEEIFRRIEDLQGATSAAYGVARALFGQGEHEQAEARLSELLAAAEQLRRRVDEPELRTAYVDQRHHYWRLDVANKMALADEDPGGGWSELALAASERGRARALLDVIEAADPARAAGADRREEERALLDRLNKLEAKRRQRRGDDLARVEQRIAEVRRDLRRLRATMRPPTGRETASEGLVSRTQKQLRDKTLMLVYSLGEEESYAWAVAPERVVAARLAAGGDVEVAVHRLREALHSAAAEDEPLRRAAAASLARLVLDPVWRALEAGKLDRHDYERLVVVADGGLHYVPFAVLPSGAGDGAEPLLDDYEIVAQPSMASLVALRQRQLFARKQAAILFDPVYAADDPRLGDAAGTSVPPVAPLSPLERAAEHAGTNLERLPATRREAEAIVEAFNGEMLSLSGFGASREAVLSGRLGEYRILHFATHGLIDRVHPELSGLALSQFGEDGEPRDGFLRLADVQSLRLNAELVVLSACESGVGREYRGEGVSGFTHGFLSAGAQRLVVSLWKVGDDETADLMRRFYTAMAAQGDHASPAAALRSAQRALLAEPEPDSHRWGAFVFVGDWSGFRSGDDPIEKAEHGGGGDPPPTDPDDDLPPPARPTFFGGAPVSDPADEEKP